MPIYVYQVILEGEEEDEGQIFEVQQAMDDPPLTEHPTTGQPIRRLVQPPHLAGRWSEHKEKGVLSDANLERHGLTRYVKTDEGVYEKTAGKGPKRIRK